MRLHRFFIGRDLHEGVLPVDDRDLCHQWSSVLRMKAGDRLIACDGKGHQAEAVIETLTPKGAVLHVGKPEPVTAEPQRRITLCCAVLKRENFEWVVQKATEAGVSKIVPLLTARTVKTGLKHDRLLRIAREAAEQSGRGIVPEIAEAATLEAFLHNIAKPAVFFHCGTDGDGWVKDAAAAETATCLVGPEGGWSDEEAELARKHGCTIASLGALTLRAETAAVIATYRLVNGL